MTNKVELTVPLDAFAAPAIELFRKQPNAVSLYEPEPPKDYVA